MSTKLHIDKLNKEELEYEIKIRGVNPQGTCKDLVITLRQLVNLEKGGHSFKCTSVFTASDELKICELKLKEIKSSLAETFTYSLIRKLEARITHILGRIEHIVTSDKDEIEKRSIILSQALEYLNEFENKQAAYVAKSKEEENPLDVVFETSIIEQNINTSTPIKGVGNPNNADTFATNVTQGIDNLSLYHKINISNWGLKFNGESDALGLNAFLIRVNELRESRGLTTQQLFRCAVELFEGKALVYFRSLKDKISDWDTLCNIFRKEFLPRDFNEQIWQQIKTRTQGDKESIAIYVAYMNSLFSRLTVTVDESVKLKIVRKNLLPFYQNQLLLIEITSLDHLIEICRKIEDNRKNVLEYTPPSSSKYVVEKDLSYIDEGKGVKKKLDSVQFSKNVSFEGSKSPILKHRYDLDEYTNIPSVSGSQISGYKKKSRDSSLNSRENSRERYEDYSKNRDSSLESNSSRYSESNTYRSGKGHKSRKDSVDRNRYKLDNIEKIGDHLNRDIRDKDRNIEGNRVRDIRDREYRGRNVNRDIEYTRNGDLNRYSRDRDYSAERRYPRRDFSYDRDRNYPRDKSYTRDRDYRYRDYSRNRFRDYSRDRNHNYYRDQSKNRYCNDTNSRRSSHNFNFSNNRQNNFPITDHNNGNSKNEIICYKCKGKNHIARFCTFNSGNLN